MSNVNEGTELSMSESLVDSLTSVLGEAAAKKKISFAGGKKHVKFDCPPGYKLGPNGKTCVKMSASELMARKKGAKKGALKRRSKAATIAKKRALTMRKRNSAGL